MEPKNICDVAIIGAGLAGAFSAFAVARRGAKAILLDQASQLASKGSGNPFALLTPYISTKRSASETLYGTGYCYTHDILQRYPLLGRTFHACGAIQLPSTRRLRLLIESEDPILGNASIKRVSSSDATDITGTEITTPALHILDAGFLSPRSLIEAALSENRHAITPVLNALCIRLTPHQRRWVISCDDNRTWIADAVIVCGAHETLGLSQYSWLPLEAIRGQTVCTAATPLSSSLRCVVSYGGYVTPSIKGTHLVGAHYSHNDEEQAPRARDSELVVNNTNLWLPGLHLTNAPSDRARVCFRTSTIDRLPFIGKLPDYASLRGITSTYRSGSNLKTKIQPQVVPGLYINVGHGSRGLLSCPLGGEIIARIVYGEPLNELTSAASATDPMRVVPRLLTAAV